jgi:hypothetical protein
MRSILCSLSVLLISGAVVVAQDAPTTAPSNVPVAKLDSPFDLAGRANTIVNERQKDPFKTIVVDMGTATDLLTRFNTSEPVQPQQKVIIGMLDVLIEELENQMKNVKGGTNPNGPLPDSAVIGGKLTYGRMTDPASSTRLWGQLPPRQREQILQSQNEGFPAGYESILSSYYRRLAQENVTGSGDAAAPPAPAPVSP